MCTWGAHGVYQVGAMGSVLCTRCRMYGLCRDMVAQGWIRQVRVAWAQGEPCPAVPQPLTQPRGTAWPWGSVGSSGGSRVGADTGCLLSVGHSPAHRADARAASGSGGAGEPRDRLVWGGQGPPALRGQAGQEGGGRVRSGRGSRGPAAAPDPTGDPVTPAGCL